MKDSLESTVNQKMSRRGFLKLATGTVLGASLLSMHGFKTARAAKSASRSLKPVAYSAIPQNAIASANASNLIDSCWNQILDYAGSIQDASLRSSVISLLNNPLPTFMKNYSSASAREALYNKLAAKGLVDPAKIDAAHILPPFDGTVQAFKTAPGSGYGSHHPYPGGLATHVNANLHITSYICKTYQEVFLYDVNRDIAIAAQALHDIAKPFVFQWQKNGASLKEYTIAGQGAHHVISLAEVIYRGFPAEEVVAQACAHAAPTSKKDEADVVSWLTAAAIMAGKDPVAYGLLNATGDGLPAPHHQEGYIVHLGDHDWVLSSPAAQKTVNMLKEIARRNYGMSDADLNGAKFNHFRNYVGSQLSYMYLNCLQAEPDGFNLAAREVAKVIR
jgi:hypothetical protein